MCGGLYYLRYIAIIVMHELSGGNYGCDNKIDSTIIAGEGVGVTQKFRPDGVAAACFSDVCRALLAQQVKDKDEHP